MKGQKDRFSASPELGARLRGLRLAAGLTQAGLARAAGCDWDQALVSRLEAGDYPNPGLGLVADYLRVCRASFEDLADILNAYTSRPLPAEVKAREDVKAAIAGLPEKVAAQAFRYDVKTTIARRVAREPALSAEERVKRVLNLAAAANRRKRLDVIVSSIVDDPEVVSNPNAARMVERFARKAWGVLARTRGSPPYQRTRLMARLIGESLDERLLPVTKLHVVKDRIAELFAAMERTGAFVRVGARPKTRREPRLRPQDPVLAAGIAREAYINTGLSDAVRALQARASLQANWNGWYVWLLELGGKVYDTLPGTPEREQVMAEALKRWPDSEDAKQLADLAASGMDTYLKRAGAERSSASSGRAQGRADGVAEDASPVGPSESG